MLQILDSLIFLYKKRSYLNKVREIDEKIFILSEEKKGLEGLRQDQFFSDSMLDELEVYLKDKEFQLKEDISKLESELKLFETN